MTSATKLAIRIAVEAQHGGPARLHSVVSIDERHDGKPVWQGEVHVFDLKSLPGAFGTFASLSAVKDPTKHHLCAVVSVPPILTAVDTISAAIVAEHRARR